MARECECVFVKESVNVREKREKIEEIKDPHSFFHF